MGNADTKLHFRKAVLQLTTKTQPIPGSDEAFWSQFWGDHVGSAADVFVLLPAAEVRALRETAPSNLATLCYKAVERLVLAADAGAGTYQDQQAVLNCVRILTRLLPYIFEDRDWRGFFWSSLPCEGAAPAAPHAAPHDGEESLPLAHSLVNALCDLLFCPDFTVTSSRKGGIDAHEDLATLDSCEYIWEAGVGAAHAPPHCPAHDANRREILKLLLTCCSQIIYQAEGEGPSANPWLSLLTGPSNRHALPLFTSLLNTVCGYDPVGRGVPYNHLLFTDTREGLVETCLQLLVTALDAHDAQDDEVPDNLFISYLSRIHRDEDLGFVLQGFTRLLLNPLHQPLLPHSTRRVALHQELLVFFWRFCDYNKKFLFYVLKSSEVLEVLVPILYHLNDARADQSRVGLLHVGVFILLLLSGERNFGVRLNKPYAAAVPMDVPVFTGSHADLVVLVFHKIITTGHQRLQPLFDCLLTILVNVSPYIKSLSMVGANKLLHLLEAFCTPWFLFSAPHHHHLVFFLLETFNNIIQYQFDGNSNLVYTIIRKRQVFHALANLPTDTTTIRRALHSRRGGGAGTGGSTGTGMTKRSLHAASDINGKLGKMAAAHQNTTESRTLDDESKMAADPDKMAASEDSFERMDNHAVDDGSKMADEQNRVGKEDEVEGTEVGGGVGEMMEGSTPGQMMEGSTPAQEAPPGTHTCTLAALPRLDSMTQQSSAHTSAARLSAAVYSPHSPSVSTPSSPPPSTPPPSSTIASFSPNSPSTADSSPASSHRTPRAPPTGGIMYPPSPHISTKVQPPSHPHHPLHYAPHRPQGADRLPGTAKPVKLQRRSASASSNDSARPALSADTPADSAAGWSPTAAWVEGWKAKLPLHTIMRLLQVLVPQVEKICIDRGLTDETEILRFLQHGTLVGLLPVPHPILIRKYQANAATAAWFRTYTWGVIYLRNVDPPIWYDTDVRLFEIQRV